jgi:hypothetical protein
MTTSTTIQQFFQSIGKTTKVEIRLLLPKDLDAQTAYELGEKSKQGDFNQLGYKTGSKTDVSVDVVKAGLDWLETHGETMELKEGVTPGKGLKRFRSCLVTAIALGASEAIEQAQKPKTAPPKPTKKNQ